jgi:DNA polymerase III epsilon subunit-like protein
MSIAKKNCVYFDINTTGADRYLITQIGAVHAGSTHCFNEKPNLESYQIATVLVNFFEWLKTLNNRNPVVLIAHYGKRLDKQVLETVAQDEKDFSNWNLLLQNPKNSILNKVAAGYCDSLVAFRNNFPKVKKHSMETLAEHFGIPRRSHYALEDPQLLKDLTLLENKK